MKRYALIGKDIQGSLSPVIHGAYGCQYDLLDIEEHQLEWALSLPYDGFNVTSPYKEKVIKYLDLVTGDIVNTISKDGDRLLGYNTDAYGFKQAVEIAGLSLYTRIGIIGNGATSKTLQSMIPNHIIIDGRNLHPNGFSSFAGLHGLINATPYQGYDLTGLSKSAWVVDLGYKDPTFINNARARGNYAFNGMGMLMAQAKESQRIWNA